MRRLFLHGIFASGLIACSQPPPAPDAAQDAAQDASVDRTIATMDADSTIDASDGDAFDAAFADAPREIAYIDAPVRDRAAIDAGPRCYGITGSTGLLSHVAHIPRESGGSANGASVCVGDVDNDGVKELIVPRFNEPSEIIGPDFCSRGRVLLPNYTRGCTIADLDGDGRNELVAYGNDGWDGRGTLHAGRVERATASDFTVETHVFRDLWPFDERRPIATFAAPHANVIDLDRDGRVELFVAGNFRSPFLRVWEMGAPGPAPSWTDVLNVSLTGALNDTAGALAEDIDGDGQREAIVAGSCSTGQHAHRVYRAWDQPAIVLNQPNPSHVAVGELDGVAPPEIILAHRANCYDGATQPWPLEVQRFNSATNTLSLVARVTTGVQQRESNYAAAVDVTGSPAHEILYCSVAGGIASAPRVCLLYALTAGALVRVVDPATTMNFRWESPPRLAGFDGIVVADLDEDNARELILFGQEHIDVLRGPRR
ncbi:MAG: VCBS repeat-containing protein [Polyangiales bacterium]